MTRKIFIFLTGTGEHASQQGMNIGGIRHASDIKADDMTSKSQGMLHPQTGNLAIFVVFFRIWFILCKTKSINNYFNK